jgi:hypothetical protein
MENIALAFSGGGFRASAFSLGCLSYLNKVNYNNNPLLQNVKFISSASGGSITNLMYSAFVYDNNEEKDFAVFYKKLYDFMQGENLLNEALSILKNPKSWNNRKDKSRNVINAFSLAYDKALVEKEFGFFCNQKNSHLEEICVNTTEFTNGHAFRFQSQDATGKISNGLVGNKFIYFTNAGMDYAKKIKLADILAASSCFPSGFEPMLFPQDFTTEAVTKENLLNGMYIKENKFTITSEEDYNNTDFLEDKNFIKEKQFALMDGGIADNQAIDAFILADERRENTNRPKFDLFLSCDVSSYFMDAYTLPIQKKMWYDFISFKHTQIILFTIFGLIASWVPFSLWYFWSNWYWWNTISTIVASFFFLPILFLAIKKIFNNKETSNETGWGRVFKKYLPVFTSMSLGRLKYLIQTRVKSVFILASDVYLKQIRKLHYERLYNDANYKDRVIQNAIYTLSKVKFDRNIISTDALYPSVKIIEVAEKARTMGTTLWFDANHEKEKVKDAIIATGQFTTCYNLLKYISKLTEKSNSIIELEKQLIVDYEKFNDDPFCMMG